MFIMTLVKRNLGPDVYAFKSDKMPAQRGEKDGQALAPRVASPCRAAAYRRANHSRRAAERPSTPTRSAGEACSAGIVRAGTAGILPALRTVRNAQTETSVEDHPNVLQNGRRRRARLGGFIPPYESKDDRLVIRATSKRGSADLSCRSAAFPW